MKQNQLPSLLKHPGFLWSAAAFALFALIPWLVCFVIRSDAAMAICFILWYAIDPVFAIAAGMFAGRDPRRMWYVPLLIPALFILASWTCFEWGDPAYITYALMYLLMGGTTMFVFLLLTNGKRK